MVAGRGETSKHWAGAKRNGIGCGNEAKTKNQLQPSVRSAFSPRCCTCLSISEAISRSSSITAVWFRSQVGAVPASLTTPSRDVIEPTKDYWLDMAALAAELEKLLIKHADGYHNSPVFAATGTT
jgi:hypothetical protein